MGWGWGCQPKTSCQITGKKPKQVFNPCSVKSVYFIAILQAKYRHKKSALELTETFQLCQNPKFASISYKTNTTSLQNNDQFLKHSCWKETSIQPTGITHTCTHNTLTFFLFCILHALSAFRQVIYLSLLFFWMTEGKIIRISPGKEKGLVPPHLPPFTGVPLPPSFSVSSS